MSTIQLNPPLPMSCPKGEGFAHFLIDYGPESDLYWTIFVTATGEVWTYANKHVRASKNITLGRTLAPKPTSELESDIQLRNRLRSLVMFTADQLGEVLKAAGADLDAIALSYGYARAVRPQL